MLSFGFRIFCWYRGFCHRTGSDLLFFSFSICVPNNTSESAFLFIVRNSCIKGRKFERLVSCLLYRCNLEI